MLTIFLVVCPLADPSISLSLAVTVNNILSTPTQYIHTHTYNKAQHNTRNDNAMR